VLALLQTLNDFVDQLPLLKIYLILLYIKVFKVSSGRLRRDFPSSDIRNCSHIITSSTSISLTPIDIQVL